jgi:hypothetical protein
MRSVDPLTTTLDSPRRTSAVSHLSEARHPLSLCPAPFSSIVDISTFTTNCIHPIHLYPPAPCSTCPLSLAVAIHFAARRRSTHSTGSLTPLPSFRPRRKTTLSRIDSQSTNVYAQSRRTQLLLLATDTSSSGSGRGETYITPVAFPSFILSRKSARYRFCCWLFVMVSLPPLALFLLSAKSSLKPISTSDLHLTIDLELKPDPKYRTRNTSSHFLSNERTPAQTSAPGSRNTSPTTFTTPTRTCSMPTFPG